MATHSSILAWRIPTDRGAWRNPWGHKESDTTERLSTHRYVISLRKSLFGALEQKLFWHLETGFSWLLKASSHPGH